MLKKILSLLLTVAVVLSLVAMAGCGKEKGANNSGVASTASGVDALAEEEYFLDVPSELKGTKVQFATWIAHDTTDTGEVLAKFEQVTGIKPEIVLVNQEDYTVKLAALINAGQSPDVLVENGDFPSSIALLTPLTKEETGLDVTDPFWDQKVVDFYTVGKYPYLVNGSHSSWDLASSLTYFNKTVLEENGIKSPSEYAAENNWTLDSMKTLMRQINQACGYNNPGTEVTDYVIATIFGGQIISWDTTTDTFANKINSQEMTEAYQWLLQCKEEGLLKYNSEHGNDIQQGKGALQLTAAYGLRSRPGWFYEMDLDDLAFELLPKKDASSEQPYTGTARAYGICKGSKNPKAATYFLRWFLNEDHYNLNQVFKNDEAVTIYKTLRENKSTKYLAVQGGVAKVAAMSPASLTADVFNGSSAQVRVNLAKASNVVDDCVNRANAVIQDVIANQ